MADAKLSGLPNIEELADDALVYVAHNGQSYSMTGADLKQIMAAQAPIQSDEFGRIKGLTQAEYDAIAELDPTVLYVVTD